MAFSAPRLLTADDNAVSFSCGNDSLDDWLRNHAYKCQSGGYARVFAACYQGSAQIAGYCALTCAHISHGDNKRSKLFDPYFIFPCVYLARLAVDKKAQRQGLGKALLYFSMEKALAAAENIGLVLFIAEPVDGAAQSFYEHYDFEVLHTNAGQLFYRRLKDII